MKGASLRQELELHLVAAMISLQKHCSVVERRGDQMFYPFTVVSSRSSEPSCLAFDFVTVIEISSISLPPKLGKMGSEVFAQNRWASVQPCR